MMKRISYPVNMYIVIIMNMLINDLSNIVIYIYIERSGKGAVGKGEEEVQDS